MNTFDLYGLWKFKCYEKKKLIWEEKTHNIITYEALTHALNVLFKNGSQIGTWYILLFSSNYRPCRTDTYATPGFSEYTGYAETTRPEWVEGAISSGHVVSNSGSPATYSFLSTITLYGASLVGGGSAPNIKGNTNGGGTMFSSVRFASSHTVMVDQVISIEYSIGAAAPSPVIGDCI